MCANQLMGIIDITDKLPPICRNCQQHDFIVDTSTLYENNRPKLVTVSVRCTREDVCRYILGCTSHTEEVIK